MIEVADQQQSAHRKARIFISYSRKDMAFAEQLEAALKTRGFEPLIDRQDPITLQDWSKGIAPFEDWWKRIEILIGKADTIVFVLSPDAIDSKVALREIDYAVSLNKRFAPIVCRKVDDAAVPQALQRLNYIFFDDASRFDASADHLAAALEIDLDWIRRHSEYGEAAQRWATAGRPGPHGLLLRSPMLEEAERWIASRPQSAPMPTSETIAFVAQSRRAAVSRRRRGIALASAVALMMLAGLVAWWQQDWLKTRLYVLKNVKVLTTAQENALKPGQSFSECTGCPEMMVLPRGSFMMGSPDGQGEKNEHPQHNVTIAQPLAVSKFVVTFAQWDVCAAQGGCIAHVLDNGWGRGSQPVVNVSWNEAKEYVAWLSLVTGRIYRLLSEAEFEYAARAGTTTAYPWGDDVKPGGVAMAKCNGCSNEPDANQTAPVGSFPPNGFGLYDMAGNVWEWTEDCWHTSYNGAPTDGMSWSGDDWECTDRTMRGGSWFNLPHFIRTATRKGFIPASRDNGIGFRVARTLAAVGTIKVAPAVH